MRVPKFIPLHQKSLATDYQDHYVGADVMTAAYEYTPITAHLGGVAGWFQQIYNAGWPVTIEPKAYATVKEPVSEPMVGCGPDGMPTDRKPVSESDNACGPGGMPIDGRLVREPEIGCGPDGMPIDGKPVSEPYPDGYQCTSGAFRIEGFQISAEWIVYFQTPVEAATLYGPWWGVECYGVDSLGRSGNELEVGGTDVYDVACNMPPVGGELGWGDLLAETVTLVGIPEHA